MDENENKSNAGENAKNVVSSAKDKTTTVLKKVVELAKTHRKVLIGVVVVILALVVLSNLFLGGKKRVVKKFVNALDDAKAEKAIKCIDVAGYMVLSDMDKDDYEDFYDEYKDYVDSDDWEETQEDYEEDLDDKIESFQDDLEDSETKTKIKKFKKVEKVGKNLYEVKVQLESKDEDGDKNTDTTTFYVMKKGLSYYVVGGDLVWGVMLYL